jgi:hypothetical protein
MPEPYAKMSVGFDDDPKIVALARYGEEAPACRDLYLAMIRYSKRNLTDGFVPTIEVVRLAFPLAEQTAMRLVDHLVSVSLCVPHTDGYAVRNYAKWNGTRMEALQRRENSRRAALTRWSETHSGSHAEPNANGNAKLKGTEVPVGASVPDRYAGARDPSGARPLHGLPADDDDDRWRFARGPGAASKPPPPRRRRPEDRTAAEASAQSTGRQPQAPLSGDQARAHADDIRQALANLRVAGLTSADDGDPDDPEFT